MTQTETNKRVQQLIEKAERYMFAFDHLEDDDDYDCELVELSYEIPELVLELKEELMTMFE